MGLTCDLEPTTPAMMVAHDSSDKEALSMKLAEWLVLGLSNRLVDAAARWCDDHGAGYAGYLEEVVDCFANALGLGRYDVDRVMFEGHTDLNYVLPNTKYDNCVANTASQFTLRSDVSVVTDGQSIIASTDFLAVPEDLLQQIQQHSGNCLKLSPGSICLSKKKISPLGVDDLNSDSISRHDSNDKTSFTIGGLLSGFVSSLPLQSSRVSLAKAQREDFRLLKNSLEVPSNSRKPALPRTETVGYSLVDLIYKKNSKLVRICEGQTGAVFAFESDGDKIAVFKPVSGENFTRKSIHVGQGAIREEAVYLVDQYCGNQACVPLTTLASFNVEGESQHGSVQAFITDVIGFIEDFAMPRNIVKAVEFVSQETAEALAFLDMRVFNMDRHSGNLLLLKRKEPHHLGPIDHGCSLPPWWALSEACFDAWLTWPQLKMAPSQSTQVLAQIAADTLQDTCDALLALGLEQASVITLEVCTYLVHIGVIAFDIPLAQIAALMVRDETSKLSWLETKVLECSGPAGCHCCLEVDQCGEEMLVVDENGAGLDTSVFLSALEHIFHTEMLDAVACIRAPSWW